MLYPVELLAHMEIPIGFEPMILGLQPSALPLGYGIIVGAGGGTRTHTPLRITDFESVSSANSDTPAFIFLSLTPDGASEKSEVHRGGTLKITYILNCQISLKNQGLQPKW